MPRDGRCNVKFEGEAGQREMCKGSEMVEGWQGMRVSEKDW